MNNIDTLEEKEKKAIELLKQEPDFSLSYYKRENAIDIVLKLVEILIAENKELKEKNKKAKEFIEENSHEIYCKRDELIELEFDDNTNATDLIDILEGNY